jgi:hypothetical protein
LALPFLEASPHERSVELAAPRYVRLFIPLILLLLISTNVSAENSRYKQSESSHEWLVSIYGGPHADDTLTDMVLFDADYSDGNYVVVGALAKEVYQYEQLVTVELEGQIGRHFGDTVDHWEFAGLALGRWHQFPWDEYVNTSFAFGTGVSYYTEESQIELEEDGKAQKFLGALLLELTFSLPEYPRWNLMIRIHHRSSAGDLIGTGSTNYLCGGLKFTF